MKDRRTPALYVKREELRGQYKDVLREDISLAKNLFKDEWRRYFRSQLEGGRTIEDIEQFRGKPERRSDSPEETEEYQLISKIIHEKIPDPYTWVHETVEGVVAELRAYQNEQQAHSPEKRILGDSLESEDFLREHIIKKYLSYEDAALPDEVKKSVQESNIVSESARKYAAAVLALSERHGLKAVEDRAKDMMQDCNRVLSKIGIVPSPYSVSKSWAMWDIGKQYYFLTHPDESDSRYSISDPLVSEEKYKEIVNRHVGWEIYDAYQRGKRGQMPEGLKRLAGHQDIAAYLDKLPKTNGTLSSQELAILGGRVSSVT